MTASRSLSAALWCVLGAFSLAILVAPLAKVLVESTLYEGRPEYDMARVFRRLVQSFAVVLILCMQRRLQLWRRLGSGFTPLRGGARDLILGGLLAVAVVVVFQGIGYLEGSIRPSDEQLGIRDVAKILYLATVTSVTEEILFSALLLALLVEGLGTRKALVFRGVLFALLHLLRTDFDVGVDRWTGEPHEVAYGVDIWIGLKGLWNATSHLRGPWPLWLDDVGEMFGLFLFSTVLGVAYLRTGNLYLAIGLHWGFVFAMRMDKFLVETAPDPSRWLVGPYTMYSSPAAFSLLLLVTLVVGRWPWTARAAARPPFTDPPPR